MSMKKTPPYSLSHKQIVSEFTTLILVIWAGWFIIGSLSVWTCLSKADLPYEFTPTLVDGSIMSNSNLSKLPDLSRTKNV
jgi:hypothetical protein